MNPTARARARTRMRYVLSAQNLVNSHYKLYELTASLSRARVERVDGVRCSTFVLLSGLVRPSLVNSLD